MRWVIIECYFINSSGRCPTTTYSWYHSQQSKRIRLETLTCGFRNHRTSALDREMEKMEAYSILAQQPTRDAPTQLSKSLHRRPRSRTGENGSLLNWPTQGLCNTQTVCVMQNISECANANRLCHFVLSLSPFRYKADPASRCSSKIC